MPYRKRNGRVLSNETTVYLILTAVFFLFWGSSKLLNTPVVESYRFGNLYGGIFVRILCIFTGYRVESVKKWRFVTAVAAVCIWRIFYCSGIWNILWKSSLIKHMVCKSVYIFYGCLAVFGLFAFYCNQRTKVTAWLGSISFSVYVLHIPVILLALALLQNVALPVWLQYILLTVIVYIVTPAAGWLIKKIPVVRYLILGIRKNKD